MFLNVLFSRDIERLILTKVNNDVFVNEARVNGLWPQGWSGVKK